MNWTARSPRIRAKWEIGYSRFHGIFFLAARMGEDDLLTISLFFCSIFSLRRVGYGLI